MRASLPLALLVLTGCPRSDTASGPVAARPSGGATPDAAARAEFEDLAAACVAGDPGAVLPHLADQGLGGGPRYARAMRPDDPMAGEIVHDVCAALPPSLLVLATLATQSDGHAWVTVTVRDGDDGSIAYRFVDVGGAWLLAAVALRDDQRAVARQGRFAAADEHLAEQGQGAAADGDNLPASVVFDRCVLERDYGLGADVDHPRGDDLVAGIVDAGQRAIRVRQAAGGVGLVEDSGAAVPLTFSASLVQRLGKRVKVVLEVDTGAVVGDYDSEIADGFLFWYGLRFHSANIGVDLGLVKPIYSGSSDDEILPLGFPMLSFQYRGLPSD